MYRMELKDFPNSLLVIQPDPVPNVPYGVERSAIHNKKITFLCPFLMYRVELKVVISQGHTFR